MNSRTGHSVPTHEATAVGATVQPDSESFVVRQASRYKIEIGDAIAEVLHDASERAFIHNLWVLDDRFLARIDAVCDTIAARATIYYGISKSANRRLLRELERYAQQLASGLDVLSAQFSEDALARGSPPRYRSHIATVFEKIREVDNKLLEK